MKITVKLFISIFIILFSRPLIIFSMEPEAKRALLAESIEKRKAEATEKLKSAILANSFSDARIAIKNGADLNALIDGIPVLEYLVLYSNGDENEIEKLIMRLIRWGANLSIGLLERLNNNVSDKSDLIKE